MTATSDMERLLARGEPGLEVALTQQCLGGPYAHFFDNKESSDCMACGQPLNKAPGRVPLAPDSAHVALEVWFCEHGGSIQIRHVPAGMQYTACPPSTWDSSGLHVIGGVLQIRDTLEAAMLAALESQKER